VTDAEGIVFVVDDDESLREALSSLIRSIGLKVQVFATAAEFLAHPPVEVPACLVLDVRLPGLSGLDLQQQLGQSAAAIPIIFITGHGDIPMSVRAMKAGAAEFLPKPFREEDLVAAIRVSLERNRQQRAGREEHAALHQHYETLSPREREVLVRVARGLLNKQVAAELGITEDTVKVHRRRIMEKLGAKSFAQVVLMAEKLQLLARE
jgi:RNA polymerase sigma factor (sigma-70 family)